MNAFTSSSPEPRICDRQMPIQPEAPTILVVDDKAFARHMVVQVLQNSGYTDIVEADGGSAAIEVFQHLSRPVDVMITDLMMPDMDGIELVRPCV